MTVSFPDPAPPPGAPVERPTVRPGGGPADAGYR